MAVAKAWKGLGSPIMDTENNYIAYVDQFYQFNEDTENKVVNVLNDVSVYYKEASKYGDYAEVYSCYVDNDSGNSTGMTLKDRVCAFVQQTYSDGSKAAFKVQFY